MGAAGASAHSSGKADAPLDSDFQHLKSLSSRSLSDSAVCADRVSGPGGSWKVTSKPKKLMHIMKDSKSFNHFCKMMSSCQQSDCSACCERNGTGPKFGLRTVMVCASS